jgi:hypothetical protein
MPIPIQEPIQTPVIPSKLFDILWIYHLAIHCPTTSRGSVQISCLPMSSSTGDLGSSSLLQTVQTDELFLAVQQVPEVAIAFQSVINAVAPLQAWVNARNNPVIVEPTPE